MAPTIVTRGGEPLLALGSPGGSTIITTVLQILVERIDLGQTLPEAIATPRASQRNTADDVRRARVHRRAGGGAADRPRARCSANGRRDRRRDRRSSSSARGRFLAAAEPVRRGGGSAMVVRGRR